MTFIKHDTNKPRPELFPPEALLGISEVLAIGAAKYSDHNWAHGAHWSRYFGALMRHMWAWWSGEANDPETGKSHLLHAGCCIAFLIAYEARSIGVDDRPKPQ